jgi:hypothetical protein
MTGFKFFRPAVAEEPDAYWDGAGPRTRSSSVSSFTPQQPRGTGIHDGKGPRDVSLPSRTARRYLRRAADPGHGLVNPRREPMCPHELVDQPPPYHRYAIAVRKLPDLGGRSPHF